jgi:hypothetical protein
MKSRMGETSRAQGHFQSKKHRLRGYTERMRRKTDKTTIDQSEREEKTE